MPGLPPGDRRVGVPAPLAVEGGPAEPPQPERDSRPRRRGEPRAQGGGRALHHLQARGGPPSRRPPGPRGVIPLQRGLRGRDAAGRTLARPPAVHQHPERAAAKALHGGVVQREPVPRPGEADVEEAEVLLQALLQVEQVCLPELRVSRAQIEAPRHPPRVVRVPPEQPRRRRRIAEAEPRFVQEDHGV
ncbi:MAG: hypothetical protein ACK559_11935, partial [bacterium]